MRHRLEFWIDGVPVPKQSFRVTGKGRGRQDPRVTAWCNEIALQAKQCANQNCWSLEEATGRHFRVECTAYLPGKKRSDVDNLAKAVLDGLKGVLFPDDNEVIELVSRKINGVTDPPGMLVIVEEL